MGLGYFDTIADKQIQRLEDGRKVFFPLGKWFVGYVIPSTDFEEAIRGRIKTYTISLFALMVVFFSMFGDKFFSRSAPLYLFLIAILALMALTFILACVFYFPLVRGLERVTAKESSLSTSLTIANRMSPALILGLLIGSFIFAFLSIWSYFRSGDYKMLLGAIFFGALCIPYTINLYRKMSK